MTWIEEEPKVRIIVFVIILTMFGVFFNFEEIILSIFTHILQFIYKILHFETLTI